MPQLGLEIDRDPCGNHRIHIDPMEYNATQYSATSNDDWNVRCRLTHTQQNTMHACKAMLKIDLDTYSRCTLESSAPCKIQHTIVELHFEQWLEHLRQTNTRELQHRKIQYKITRSDVEYSFRHPLKILSREDGTL